MEYSNEKGVGYNTN